MIACFNPVHIPAEQKDVIRVEIDYQDLILLNTRLREEDIRYRVTYKNTTTACLEPPGACCCTPERQAGAYRVIRDYYQSKGVQVTFSEDGLYFTLSETF